MTLLPIVERWLRTRSFVHAAFPAERIAVERDATVSVVLLTSGAHAPEPVVATLKGLNQSGVVDELLIVGIRPDVPPSLGADVIPASTLMTELGPVLGRGDAMWRSLSALTGDVVAFVDADLAGFVEHVVCGLVGPLVCEPGVRYSSGHAGNEEAAGPLLARFWPELVGFHDPAPRELAATRDLLERLPFAAGSEVGAGLLLDSHAAVGLRNLAQVDVGDRPAQGASHAARNDDLMEAMTRRRRLRDPGSEVAPPPGVERLPITPGRPASAA